MAQKTTILFACVTTLLFLAPSGLASDTHQETESYPLGDGRYEVPEGHSNVMVTTEDALGGAGGPFSVCWLNPGGDDICDPQEDVIAPANCGPIILSAPWSGGVVEVDVHTALIWHDLSAVCIGTAGTITYTSW